MKKILFCALCATFTLATGIKASAGLAVGIADLKITAPHPRLLASDAEFKIYKETVRDGSNKYLTELHRAYLRVADASVEKNAVIERNVSAAGKLLAVSRDVLKQSLACAYAFRYTGSKSYLKRATSILDDVCAFEDWNPRHYLDVAEMSAAVALCYDWLYNSLSKKQRATYLNALKTLSLDCAENERFRKRFHAGNNWGQVLNGSLIATAIAVYEDNPTRSEALIRRAVQDNYEKMGNYYSDDGLYPEGPGYWNYGTQFQILGVSSLLAVYGTDFGLTDVPGWKRTAWFQIFAVGNTGRKYNYSDGGEKADAFPQLWYFASQVNGPSILYTNLERYDSEDDIRFGDRLGAMYLLWAAKVRNPKAEEPKERVFAGQGTNPLVLARTGWKRNDLYLGAKGGRARNNHGHMDVGSFVFDAYGVRWAREALTDGYTIHEVNLPKLYKKSLWKMDQESYRWFCPGYNNREHSTLTVNDHNHIALGVATMDEVFDTPDAIGARFNLTAAFGDDLAKEERTLLIRDDSYLEISDDITTPADKPAEIRWTFVSGVAPKLVDDGIEFTSGKVTMKLRTDAEGAQFQTWSTNPADYPDNPTSAYLPHESKAKKGEWLCGYTFSVPAGQEVKVVTTLKRIK